MSLKTKGLSRETEALILIGGGENRTLVLSKLHDSDYMLIVFKKMTLMKDATLEVILSLSILNSFLKGQETEAFIPGLMTTVTSAPGQALGYREI